MESPNPRINVNAEALDIDNETIAQTGESATPKAAKLNDRNASDANTTGYPVATFTLVLSVKPNLTKRYDLVDGMVEKTAAGKLSLGKAMTFTKPIDQMIDTLTQQATANHALIHGVSGYDEIRVVTKGNEAVDAISRSRRYFSYDDNALLMFDHDPSDRGTEFTFENCDSFLATLAEVYPDIEAAGFVVKPSASAGIMRDGEPVTNKGGFHAYAVAKHGRDIPRFTDVLFKRLIIKKYGHAFITQNGSVHVRTIFDKAIYQPERLDYVAAAIVGEGLTIDQPAPLKFPGGSLDTSLMPDLTTEEEILYKAEHKKLMDGAVEEARDVRGAYLKQRSLNTGVPIEKLAKQYKHGEQGAIDYEMPLTKNDGTQFSFQEAIDNPATYHGLSMRDPFEPEYGEDKAKLYINDNGSVNVHSYCHGKHAYRLFKEGNRYPHTSALKKRKSFMLKDMNELRQQPAPLQYLVDGYLIKAGLACLIGVSGIGKTFLVINLAYCIATDRKFMGKDVAQGAVVYLNAEGQTGMLYRLRALEQENSTLNDAPPPFYLSEEPVNFMEPGEVDHAAETIDAIAAKHSGRIALIVVDTLHGNMDGDENSSQDIGKFLTSFKGLCKRYGAAGLINHHPGIADPNRARGSSALKGALDTNLLLSTVGKSDRVLFKHTKLKDGPTQPNVGYQLKEVTLPWLDSKGRPITSCVPEFSECSGAMAAVNKCGPVPDNIGIALKSLITAMGSADVITKAQWRDAFYNAYSGGTDTARKTFGRSITDLVKAGVVLDDRDTYRLGDYDNSPWSDMSKYLPSSLN
jgi:hypothetical protein